MGSRPSPTAFTESIKFKLTRTVWNMKQIRRGHVANYAQQTK